jgi:hypothetical protein
MSLGCGLARPVVFAVLNGSARHEFQPVVSCLGRRPGTRHVEVRPGRHGVPCQPDTLRAMLAVLVPCRAGPARWASIVGWHKQQGKWVKLTMEFGKPFLFPSYVAKSNFNINL